MEENTYYNIEVTTIDGKTHMVEVPRSEVSNVFIALEMAEIMICEGHGYAPDEIEDIFCYDDVSEELVKMGIKPR